MTFTADDVAEPAQAEAAPATFHVDDVAPAETFHVNDVTPQTAGERIDAAMLPSAIKDQITSAKGVRYSWSLPLARTIDKVVSSIPGAPAGQEHFLENLVAGSTEEYKPPIPRIPQQQGIGAQLAAGAGNIPIDVGNFFISPEGIAAAEGFGVLPKVARTAAGLTFGEEAIRHGIAAPTTQEQLTGIGTGLMVGALSAYGGRAEQPAPIAGPPEGFEVSTKGTTTPPDVPLAMQTFYENPRAAKVLMAINDLLSHKDESATKPAAAEPGAAQGVGVTGQAEATGPVAETAAEKAMRRTGEPAKTAAELAMEQVEPAPAETLVTKLATARKALLAESQQLQAQVNAQTIAGVKADPATKARIAAINQELAMPTVGVPVEPSTPVETVLKAQGITPELNYTVENQIRDPQNRVRPGITVFDGPADNPNGVIEGAKLPSGELEAYHMVVDPKLRGTGRGVGLWVKLIQSAGDSTVVTDSSISESAAHSLEALRKRGYTIEKNPNAKLAPPEGGLPEGQWVTPDKTPVFRVTGKPLTPDEATTAVAQSPASTTPGDVIPGQAAPQPPGQVGVGAGPAGGLPGAGGGAPVVGGLARGTIEDQINAGILPPDALVIGKGWNAAEAAAEGDRLVNKGVNPDHVIEAMQGKRFMPVDPDSGKRMDLGSGVAVLESETRRLAAERAAAQNRFGLGSSQARAAEAAENNWLKDVRPRAGGLVNRAMKAFEDTTPVDLSDYNDMYKKAAQFQNGKTIPVEQQIEMMRKANAAKTAKQNASDAVEKQQRVVQETLPKVRTPNDAEMQALVDEMVKELTPCK